MPDHSHTILRLRARRKEAVISVITLISVLGVAAGVTALVVALAVTNGFRNTLQRNLLGAAQKALSVDQINEIELNVDDLNRAPEIAKEVEKVAGARYTTTTWMERNKQLLGALKMERLVTIIVISLIEWCTR